MKIPDQTKSPRFYVALNKDEAYSSWNTYDEAVDCIERFKQYKLDMLQNIAGIIEVSTQYKVWVKLIIK